MQRALEDNVIEQLIKLKQEGISSRKIAKQLGCGKSSVNHYFKKYSENNQVDASKPRITFLDLESRPDIAVTFRRFDANIGLDNILEEGGGLLSGAWRLGFDGETTGVLLTKQEAIDNNDKRLCEALWNIVEGSDIIVGHNVDRFDLPLLKARCLVNGLKPMKQVKTIDTLRIARSLKLQSNKLEGIARSLKVASKLDTGGISLWVRCIYGDEEALQSMFEYNKKDVDVMIDVYKRITPFYKTQQSFSSINKCPVCFDDLQETGKYVYANSRRYSEKVCSCGFRGKGSICG